MKLLIISTMSGFSWGGSEELWWQTALYAHKQGHEINIIVFENKPIHKKLLYLQDVGIHIDYIGNHETILPPIWKRVLLKIFRKTVDIKYSDRFSFLHGYNADLIFLNQGGATDITYYEDLQNCFVNLKLPYVVLNQYHPEYGSLTQNQQKILLNLFLRAKHLFFVAHRNKVVLERQLAVELTQAEVVKNPVNLANDSILEWPVSEVPLWAVVARLDIYFKGQDILLQVLSTKKWKERVFSVNLFGQGPHEEYLKNLILFYGLEQKVFLKGHSDDIAKLWHDHHLLILPSHSEGTPLSLVEAMLCGRPCLVTDVGDCAALVIDNETGWVAYTASVKALDEALERAWQKQQDWKQMGILANKKAKEFEDKNAGKSLFEIIING